MAPTTLVAMAMSVALISLCADNPRQNAVEAAPESSGRSLCPTDSDRAGKSPAKGDDMEFCHGFARRTCCGARTTARIASGVVGLAQKQQGDVASTGTCKDVWARLVCAPCDPEIAKRRDVHGGRGANEDDVRRGASAEDGDGGRTRSDDGIGDDEGSGREIEDDGKVRVCSSLCSSAFHACAQEYFAGDANNLPIPCREQDVVCTRLGDWLSSGEELCAALHFASVDGGQCYAGAGESPWEALVRVRERKRSKARAEARTKMAGGASGQEAKKTRRRKQSMYRRVVTILGQGIAIGLLAMGALAAAYYRAQLTKRRRAAVITPSVAAFEAAERRRESAEEEARMSASADGVDAADADADDKVKTS